MTGQATWLMGLTFRKLKLCKTGKEKGGQLFPGLLLPFPSCYSPPEGMRSGAKTAFSLPRVLEVKQLSRLVSRLLKACVALSLTHRTQTQIFEVTMFLACLPS